MSLSKYPEQLDMFQLKKNAAFEGDPNGDDVMAEDVNELQDAIIEIEKVLGVNPQGKNLTVGERVSLLEGSSSLRVPSFLLYMGAPETFNEAPTIEKAISEYARFDHVVLASNADRIDSPSHAPARQIIKGLKENRDIKVYGYIDAGVSTANLSISEIQIKIQSWKDMGVYGIYCGNFGFENQVSRARQNQILESIHQHGFPAILQAQNPEEVFSDAHHVIMNPDWTAPKIKVGDTYHFDRFAVDTSTAEKYTSFDATISTLGKLYGYRKNLGIKIFGTPLIQSDIPQEQGQDFYEYAHMMALLGSLDGFYPVREGHGASGIRVPVYSWSPIVGNWYAKVPVIYAEGDDYVRDTTFGKISVDSKTREHRYEGLSIPYSILRIAANSIDGSLMKDDSIPDSKIKNYNGDRLIDSINTSSKRIDIARVMELNYTDIEGDVPGDALRANIIQAINANIGYATIEGAIIKDLSADKIKAGTIDAERIQASVVEALNIYAERMSVGSARIGQAVIGDLDASKITTGSLDADLISANVIDAINLSAKQAEIKNLNADNITAGNIKAERIQAEVVNAINAYVRDMVAGNAVINSAAIGELDVSHMKAKVIQAINLTAETAFIEGAKIKAATIDSGHIVDGTITNAKIGDAEIDTAKIKLGSITSALIGEQQVDTTNIKLASITTALIKEISADKINAGTLNTALVKIQGENGFLRIWGNRLQVFDDQAVPVERVSVGDVDGDGTQYGFRVRGADGTTVLYDEKGVYNEGITDGAITNPKIGDDEVDGRVIKSKTIVADHIIADQILAEHVAANAINAKHILAGTITAGSAIIAEGAIGKAQIANAAIGSAQIDLLAVESGHIKNLSADKINAGKIKAEFVEIGASTSFLEGYDPAALNTKIRSDLRLSAGLPTSITMNADGIRATTPSDPSKYVSLDFRGLYVSNGAIMIQGGLSRENISDEAASGWDGAAQYAEDMADDNSLTSSEKQSLKREWDGYAEEHLSIERQIAYYWPEGTTAPTSEATYLTRYDELRTFLTVTPDINNNLPILGATNMEKTSLMDGAILNSSLLAYKNAKFAILEDISLKAKDLADQAQKDLEEMEKNIVYRVEVISSNGNVFRNGNISTILEARVYHGSTDITSAVPVEKLIWTRTSHDSVADDAWNAAHAAGAKTITVTKDDIWGRATFSVQLIE